MMRDGRHMLAARACQTGATESWGGVSGDGWGRADEPYSARGMLECIAEDGKHDPFHGREIVYCIREDAVAAAAGRSAGV